MGSVSPRIWVFFSAAVVMSSDGHILNGALGLTEALAVSWAYLALEIILILYGLEASPYHVYPCVIMTFLGLSAILWRRPMCRNGIPGLLIAAADVKPY